MLREIHVEKNFTPSCFHSCLTGGTERYLPLQYYASTKVHADKAQKNKSPVSYT